VAITDPTFIGPRCVEHHFDDAFNIAVCGLEGADIDAEAARNGGSDLFGIQMLSLNFAQVSWGQS
jgi:hypothetical protein